ncbi:MAG TPA: GNAT family N-acetyltransferase [Woeseiaceae bacterium]|nr:GNAT family N-acetyltransferase [Woeseiaceae bacterium]
MSATDAIRIRPYEEADWPAVWRIVEPVFRAGETWPLATDVSEEEARRFLVELPAAAWVAETEPGGLVGFYYLKPNQPALGAHVANAGYIVATAARGRGVATAMCRHSQEEARARGFLAMQFNLVVATNEAAVHLWSREGFHIVGTLPKAFRHARLGLVDAHVMYKLL